MFDSLCNGLYVLLFEEHQSLGFASIIKALSKQFTFADFSENFSLAKEKRVALIR